jgi:hypothetical protein
MNKTHENHFFDLYAQFEEIDWYNMCSDKIALKQGGLGFRVLCVFESC